MKRTIKIIYEDKPVGEIYADSKESWGAIKEMGYQKLMMDSVHPSSRLFGMKIHKDKMLFREVQKT